MGKASEVLRLMGELTEVDRLARETREQLGRYPGMVAELDRADAAARKAVEDARARRETAAKEERAMEKEIAELQGKIAKYRVQQAGVKTNKEYEALNHEMAEVAGKIDALETGGLERLEVMETAAGEIEAGEKRLAEVTAENAAERERIAEQTAEKTARLEGLAGERAGLLARLEATERFGEEAVEIYEAVEKRHPGSGCVAVEGGHCGGCHWALVAHVVQDVRKGDEIVRCESCRRVLVDGGVVGG